MNLSQDQIVKAADGNPGAALAMMNMIAAGIPETVEKIIEYGIIGTNLYILYSDICRRNIALIKHLVDNCPKELLVDAANRQDYSGRELLKEWIDKNVNQ